MHQAAWFRLLMPVLGVGVLSAAAVSAGALLGLAVGSLLGGRLADRRGRPGLVFAGAEVVAAGLCFLMPFGVAGVQAVVDLFPTGVVSGTAATGTDIVATLSAALVSALAATPMGATLPAAVRALGAPQASIGAAFRRVYGWNTVGAVLGVGLAVGVLLEARGNRGLIAVASLVQMAVGLLALATLRGSRTTQPAATGIEPETPSSTSSVAPRLPASLGWAARPGRLGWAAFLAGGAGLAVQIAWVRRITPVVGNTTYAFAAVLGTYLLALALGSLLLGPRRGAGQTRGPLVILVLAAVPVALLPAALGWVGELSAGWLEAQVPTQWELIRVQAAATGLLLVPSTLIGAAALPWLVRAAAPTPEYAGRGTGRLLFMNTAGSAVFALVTALAWLPMAGSAGVLRGAAGVYLAAGALLIPGRVRVLLLVVASVLVVPPLFQRAEDEALWDVVGLTFNPASIQIGDAPRRYAVEGRVSTVVVRDREGRPELWVDSKIVASTGATDRLHLMLLGHLPMLLHPDPQHVAVIGLGTGITSTAASRWSPETLDVFELEPAVAGAAAHFEDRGGGVPAGANLVFRDGRQGIARSGRHYDVVTSDPIHPAVAGSAALYGADHYQMLRAHADIVCQWLPLYQLQREDARLIVRTFTSVFDHAYIFLMGPDAILIGSKTAIAIDESALRARLATPPALDLAAYGLRAPGRLLGLLVQDPDGARSFGETGPLNTDDHLRLEFSCGRNWYADQVGLIARSLRMLRAKPEVLLAAPPSVAFQAEAKQARQFHRTMRVWLNFDNERAVDELDLIIEELPANRFAIEMRDETLVALAQDLVNQRDPEAALALLRPLLARDDVDDFMRLEIATLLLNAGFPADARAIARPLAAVKGWPRAKRITRD